MPSDRFAEVKQLYGEVCDLVEPERSERLRALCDDAAVIDEVLALLARDAPRVTRFARPLLKFLSELSSESLQAGDVLGAWKLERQIAHGGMGTVYLAQRCDGHFEQVVAIKLLRGIASTDALAYLTQERQILARLSHPNIARLLDGGTTPGGQPYLVMEYIDGRSIEEYCRQERLSTTAVLRLFHTVCAAVSVAHQRLIVHCDLKPSNILVTADGRPLLLDFGIAQLVDAAVVEDDAEASRRACTPRYASPEQAAGQALSTATDVYSLGMLLTELLLPAANLHAELSPLQLRDDELRAIAIKATHAEIGKRYLTVDALAQDLQRYLSNEPVLARAASGRYRLRKLLQRRWPWFAVGSIFLAVSTGFVLRVLSERDRAQAAEVVAIAERDRARQADASSRQVGDFLVSIFEGSNVDAGTGNVSAAVLVEQAQTRIETELTDEPMAQSAMYATLAKVQHLMGNAEPARQNYQKAIAIERQLQRPLQLAEHLHDLAAVELAAFTPAEAEISAAAALELRERHAGDQPLLIARTMALLGEIRGGTGNPVEGRTLLLRALEIHQQVAPRSLGTATALADVAAGYRVDDQHVQAIDYYRRSLALHDALGDHSSEDYAATRHSFATSLAANRQFDEAERVLRQILAESRKDPKDDSADIAWQLAELGRMLVAAGRPLHALPLYTEAMEVGRRKIGAQSLAYAVFSNNAAVALERSGDIDGAEAACRDALAILRKSNPETDVLLALVRRNCGRVLMALGRFDDAEQPLRASARALASGENPDSADALASRIDLAEALLFRGDVAGAQTEMARVAQHVAALPATHRAAALRVDGLLKARVGDVPAAIALLTEAGTMLRAELGDGDARSWLISVDRVKLLHASEDPAQRQLARTQAGEILQRVTPLLLPQAPVLARLRALQMQ